MNKLLLGLIITFLLLPFHLIGQNIKLPKTPQNQWVIVSTTVQDSISLKPVQAQFSLINVSDSTIVCDGKSSYESWTSDDGFHEAERIACVIPDFRSKYVLEISSNAYIDKSVPLDFSETITPETPMDEREIKINLICLTKK